VLKDLIVTLGPPPALYWTRQRYEGPLRLDHRVTSRRLWTPWPALPDVLANAQTRAFVGLVYGVPEAASELVHGLCQALASEVLAYREDELGPGVYITWSDLPADEVLPGQLMEVGWHYSESAVSPYECLGPWKELLDRDGIDPRSHRPVAIGIDADEVLGGFDLVMPDSFRYPFRDAAAILP
jgi:hypothetical protein